MSIDYRYIMTLNNMTSQKLDTGTVGVFKSFAKFTVKHLCWSLFLKNV